MNINATMVYLVDLLYLTYITMNSNWNIVFIIFYVMSNRKNF